MSIKHIYEHLLEHFICLKSFIITVKFSCYALWAKSWSSFSLNSHWLQQEADLIVCGFPYKFNTALSKMRSLLSTILARKSQCLGALNKTTEPSLQIELKIIKENKPHTHKSVTLTLHYKTSPTLRLEVQGIQVSPIHKSQRPPRLHGGMFYHQLLPLGSLADAPVTKIFVLCVKGSKGQNLATSASISSSDTSRQSQPSATRQDGLEQSAQSQKV